MAELRLNILLLIHYCFAIKNQDFYFKLSCFIHLFLAFVTNPTAQNLAINITIYEDLIVHNPMPPYTFTHFSLIQHGG